MATGVNFSGIASGIDTNALIDAELASKRATRVTPLEDKVTELNDTTSALTTVQTKLVTLQAKLRSYSTLSTGAVVKTGVSSDETVATASVSNGSSNATYSITVTDIARSGKVTIPDGVGSFATSSTSMGFTGSGSFNFTVNGVTIPVPVTPTTTVSQFVDAVNTAAGSSAKAVLVNVGTTAVPAYKVLVTNPKTGASEGSIDVNLASVASSPALTKLVTPSTDAIVEIDGIGTNIQRSTNNISDILTGITFNIKAPGTSTISVQNDAASTLTSVKEFIKMYNDVISTINDNNTVVRDESSSEVKNVFGVLAKTSTDDTILSGLRSALSSISYSLTSGGVPGNNIVNFSSMGITTDSGSYDAESKTGGGTLKLAEDDAQGLPGFLSALASEPDSVNQLLTKFADLVSLTQDGGNLINNFVKAGGTLDISIKSNTTQVREMNLRIATIESQLSQEEKSLRARYASFEALTGRLQQQAAGLTSALSGLS